jgi:hypothetical protein
MFAYVSRVPIQNGAPVGRYDLDVRVANWDQMLGLAGDPNGFRNVANTLVAAYGNDWGSIAIELVLEHIRAGEFDHLPSRLQCAFAGSDELSALRFAFSYRAPIDNFFYEVTPVGEVVYADMALTNRGYELNLPPAMALDRQHTRARAYWNSVTSKYRDTVISEALLVGGASVVRQLNLPGPL